MANKFWVGGTGTWDGGTLDSGFWKTTTGGSTTTTAPTSADTAIFDNLSGAGTVTIVGNMAVTGINCNTHTGTLDFASSNITTTGAVSFTGGAVTHTVRYGSGTHTFANYQVTNASPFGLTLDVGTATIIPKGGTIGAGFVIAHIMRIPAIGTGSFIQFSSGGGAGPVEVNYLEMDTASGTIFFTLPAFTFNVKNNFHLAGRPRAPIYFRGVGGGGILTVDAGKSGFIDWCHSHGMTFGAGITLRNSYDGLGNVGTIIPPQATAIGAL